MKSPAIIVAFTIVGSLAFAAGQARVMPPQVPDQPSLPPMIGSKQGGSGGEGGVAMQVGDEAECVVLAGEPLNWFTEVHFVNYANNNCYSWTFQLGGVFGANGAAGDVDRDGVPDRLALMANGNLVAPGWIGNFNLQTFLSGSLVKWTSHVVDGDLRFTAHPVVSPAVLQLMRDRICLFTCGNIECSCDLNWASVDIKGLLDVDGDGDLDLVISTHFGMIMWLENTAASEPPLAADINKDGVVDGKDLASVLAAWTQ